MTFETALRFILAREGGYVDDPDDRGGATNQGITQSTYDAWRDDQGAPVRPVREIDQSEVEAIYRERYWYAARCDRLPPKLALVHMDAAVNHGVSRAARMLQQVVETTVDGIIGPQTLAAVAQRPEPEVSARYVYVRIEFYARIVARDASQQKFLGGWLTRMDHLRQAIA